MKKSRFLQTAKEVYMQIKITKQIQEALRWKIEFYVEENGQNTQFEGLGAVET